MDWRGVNWSDDVDVRDNPGDCIHNERQTATLVVAAEDPATGKAPVAAAEMAAKPTTAAGEAAAERALPTAESKVVAAKWMKTAVTVVLVTAAAGAATAYAAVVTATA